MLYLFLLFFFFFFQAEDGIRDRDVTGVQTCALPILLGSGHTRSDVATVRTDTRRASNVGAIWSDHDRIGSTNVLAIRCDPWTSCYILAVRSERNRSAIPDIGAVRTKPRRAIDVSTVRCKRRSFQGSSSAN